MKKICPFCNNELNANSRHIYSCAKKLGLSDKKEIKYKYLSFNYPELSNEAKLIEEYQTNLKSFPDLKKQYDIDSKNATFLLDYFNIHRRNISESSLKISGKKYRKTCQEKYGVDNVSQINEVKEKKKSTFLKNYGVDNIWKTEEYCIWLNQHMMNEYGKKRLTNGVKISLARKEFTKEKWLDIYEKFKATCQERYGVDNPWCSGTTMRVEMEAIWLEKYGVKYPIQSELVKEKLRQTILKNYGVDYPIWLTNAFNSKIELKIQDILNTLNISYTTQKRFGKYLYDIYLDDIKLILEINGDYWHANPLFYKQNEIIKYPNKQTKYAQEIWERDLIKKENAELYSCKVVYIWETDINKKSYEELEFILLSLILERQNEINKN